MTEPTRPIKVGFLITGLGLGGAERQLVRIVSNLERSRFHPIVMSLLPPVAFEDILRAHGIPLVHLGMKRGRPSLRAILKALGTLREHRTDVLVAFMVHGFLLARVLGPLVGARAVISSVRTEMTYRQPFELLTALTDRLSYATVVNGTRVAKTVVDRGAVGSERVRVIFNAAAFAEPDDGAPAKRRALRAQLGLAENAFVWIAVARLVKEKDHSSLLAAFEGLRADHPDARLLLVGDGPLRSRIESDLARRQLEQQVTCLGSRNDVDALLNAADAFVLASHVEGSPNALMEAMASGLPSVASRVGGVPDLIPSEEDGHAVPPSDVAALRTAMHRVMSLTASERRALGIRGQQRVKDNHGIPKIVGQWEDLIAEAFARG